MIETQVTKGFCSAVVWNFYCLLFRSYAFQDGSCMVYGGVEPKGAKFYSHNSQWEALDPINFLFMFSSWHLQIGVRLAAME